MQLWKKKTGTNKNQNNGSHSGKSEYGQETPKKTFTRRSAIQSGATGVAAAATASLVTRKPAEAAAGGRPLTIHCVSVHFTPGPGAGASVDNFIVVGDISMVDGVPATGKYFCKGVCFFDSVLAGGSPAPDAATFVDHRFRIDGVGSILGAGAELDGLLGRDDLAVVGGTGRFVGAAGEYSATAGGPIPFGPGFLTFQFNIRRG